MAASIPESLRTCALVALLCALGAGSAAAAEPAKTPVMTLPRPTKDPVDLVAASSDVDYKNNRLHFVQVRITQGPMQVQANEATATGLDFDNSEWTFTGDVHIKVPDGSLDSSSAVVTFKDKELASAEVRGSPAEFEHKLQDTGQIARGRADQIDYDVQGGTVKLTGAAWLTDGDNTIQGDVLIYNVAEERVAANPGSTVPGGVHITILPKSQGKPQEKPQEKNGQKPAVKPGTKPPSSQPDAAPADVQGGPP
jgi:lipopolysaccharide transport protein LptA